MNAPNAAHQRWKNREAWSAAAAVATDEARDPRHTATLVAVLTAALKPFVDSYRAHSDPGDSDLDNEQPYHVTVTLGDCRTAAAVLRELQR